MPQGGVAPAPHESILRYEEISAVVEAGVRLGIRKVRLTGGEPLVRRDVTGCISRLRQIDGLEEITMTTNGVCLADFAHDLKRAGMNRLNISLDTLNESTFREITRRDNLQAVWKGIEAALAVGFDPVKINVVVMKGLNDHEITDFGKLTMDRPLHVRFIEFMALAGPAGRQSDFLFPAHMVKERLQANGPLSPVVALRGNGPARYYSYRGALGTVGLISPVSNGFCGTCNRLRLTADGRLRPCLLSDVELDVRAALRGTDGQAHVQDLVQRAMELKTYHCEPAAVQRSSMRSIGG